MNETQSARPRAWWAAVACWLLLGVAIQQSAAFTHLLGDKAVHAAVFGVLGALAFRAIAAVTHATRLGVVALALLFGAAVGASDELLQYWQPSRTPDYADLAFDLLGTVLGATVALLLYRRR